MFVWGGGGGGEVSAYGLGESRYRVGYENARKEGYVTFSPDLPKS